LAKRKRKNRAHRIAAQVASQQAEHERERDEIALGRLSPGAPTAVQIPTKHVRVGRDFEPQADLEDDFFGGFRETPWRDEPVDPEVRRKSGRAAWRQAVQPSPWNRRWATVDINAQRFGRPVPWKRAPRKWAAELDSGPRPFVARHDLDAAAASRGADAAKQEAFERAIGLDPERERPDILCPRHGTTLFRAASLDWAARDEHEAQRDEKHGSDKRRYAHGVRNLEKIGLAPHYERRIQRHVAGWHKPSKALEAKRFPKLPKVKAKLLPKEPGRMLGFGSDLDYRNKRRAELKLLVAMYRGLITECPPETTTAMLNKRPVGRPPIGERAMSNAEKQKRYRDMLRLRLELEKAHELLHQQQEQLERERLQREAAQQVRLRLVAPISPPPTTGEQPHVVRDIRRANRNAQRLGPASRQESKPTKAKR
jgi:hypothetical protein